MSEENLHKNNYSSEEKNGLEDMLKNDSELTAEFLCANKAAAYFDDFTNLSMSHLVNNLEKGFEREKTLNGAEPSTSNNVNAFKPENSMTESSFKTTDKNEAKHQYLKYEQELVKKQGEMDEEIMGLNSKNANNGYNNANGNSHINSGKGNGYINGNGNGHQNSNGNSEEFSSSASQHGAAVHSFRPSFAGSPVSSPGPFNIQSSSPSQNYYQNFYKGCFTPPVNSSRALHGYQGSEGQYASIPMPYGANIGNLSQNAPSGAQNYLNMPNAPNFMQKPLEHFNSGTKRPNSACAPNSSFQEANSAKHFAQEDNQMKMYHSFKIMQQNNPQGGGRTFNPISSPLPSALSTLNGIEYNSPNNPNNNNQIKQPTKDDTKIIESLNRSYYVRRCADELYKIKPRFKQALQNLSKSGAEEASLISTTINLYSQILCNWKKQTMYVYSKMRASLISLQYQLETELTRGRVMQSSFKMKLATANRRNETLELNLKNVQNEIKLHSKKISNDSTSINNDINFMQNEKFVTTLKDEFAKLKEKHDQATKENLELKERLNNFAEQNKLIIDPQKEYDLSNYIFNIKKLIQRIEVMKTHHAVLDLADSKNLNSPLIKTELNSISQKLKNECRSLSQILEYSSSIESYFTNSAPTQNEKKVKLSKDSIEIEKILDRRVKENGQIQYFVQCPNSQNCSEENNDEVGEQINSGEKIWVDEKNLSGHEKLIKEFDCPKKNTVEK